MKARFCDEVEAARVKAGPYGSDEGDPFGAFVLHVGKINVKVIASCDGGWDHVSVSTNVRCPSWGEMCRVKRLFFAPDECVVQYHPPHSVYVNRHPFVLHLWRPHHADMPMPPKEYV